jgi:xylulokinase
LYQSGATGFVEQETGTAIDQYVALGGGASSPLWTQMLADSSGRDVAISDTIEVSALGAAILAAYGAGWYDTIRDAAAKMQGGTRKVTPNPEFRKDWDELLDIYNRIYADNEATCNRLVEFTEKQGRQT